MNVPSWVQVFPFSGLHPELKIKEPKIMTCVNKVACSGERRDSTYIDQRLCPELARALAKGSSASWEGPQVRGTAESIMGGSAGHSHRTPRNLTLALHQPHRKTKPACD